MGYRSRRVRQWVRDNRDNFAVRYQTARILQVEAWGDLIIEIGNRDDLDPQEKRALYLETGALAVDMESHIVARIGAARGLPVAAIRVITDPARRALPQAALAAVRPNGTTM